MKAMTLCFSGRMTEIVFMLIGCLWLSCCVGNLALAKETILLLSSEGENFQQTIKGLKDDLSDDVTFIEGIVTNKKSEYAIAKYIQTSQPKMLVFLGNKPLQAYAKYQQLHSGASFPPGIALSALYLDRQLEKLHNISGIRYEIPAVTSLVQLRTIVKRPINKVGVIYREWMSDFIRQNQRYCEQESIELVAIKIPNKVSIRQLNYQLKHLIQDIDVLWVVNDNALLQSRYLQNSWIPLLKHFDKPVVVGIKALTETNLNFGVFSVEADHYALGLQGAEMISEIMNNNWSIPKPVIEQPLSISNVLNIKLTEKKNIPVDSRKIGQIDHLIQ